MPNNYLFVFVILHYNAIEDTIECVNSIVSNMQNGNYSIVIVDNASPNGTGVHLQEKYEADSNIIVLLSDINLGFAKGNNLGFLYAKQKLKADFIVMLNNDTLLLQKDFFQLITFDYEKSGFAVLGPMIETHDHSLNTNPRGDKLPPISYWYFYLFKQYIKYVLNLLHLEKCVMLLRNLFKSKKQSADNNVLKRKENVILHGCFWVFSPQYIRLFDGINDKTFLYKEEELLYLRLTSFGLFSVYNPQIKVYHKEDASTNTLFHNDGKRNRFIYKHYIRSTKILINEIRKANSNKRP